MDSSIATKTKQFLYAQLNQTRELIGSVDPSKSKLKAEKASSLVSSLKMISMGFIKYACGGQMKDNQIQTTMKNLGSNYGVKDIDFSTLLGMAIMEQLNKNALLASIKTKVSQYMQEQNEDSDDNLSIDFQSDLKQKKSSFQQRPSSNFYARQSEEGSTTKDSDIHIQFDDSQADISVPNIDDSNFNSDWIEHEDKQIMNYLYKLSKSTTELSYLCQRLKWPQPEIEDNKSKINDNLFSCVIKLKAVCKEKVFFLESECPGAASKKEAKRVASLFILRKIYHRFKKVWELFKICRMQNPGIQQALNANNEQIFKKAKFNLVHGSMFKNEQEYQQPKNEMSIKINEYLDSLKSYKTELNVLQGKHNKRITQVSFDRDTQDQLCLWPVKASLNDNGQLLEAEAKQSSKKASQQKCCRDILFKIYSKNIARWEQFVAYKQSKGLS